MLRVPVLPFSGLYMLFTHRPGSSTDTQEWFRLACLYTCHALGQPQDTARIDFHTPAVSRSHQVMGSSLWFLITLCPQTSNCQPRVTCWDTYHFPVPPGVVMSILVPESAVFQQHHVLAQAPLSTILSSLSPVKVWASPNIRESHLSFLLCCSAFDNHVLFKDCKVGNQVHLQVAS